MQYAFPRFILILCVMLLSSCMPTHEQPYIHQPLTTPAGKACASRCMQGRTHCQQICALKYPSCRSNEPSKFSYHTKIIKDKRTGKKKRVRVQVERSRFKMSSLCSQQCQCAKAHNTCYTACGSEIG